MISVSPATAGLTAMVRAPKMVLQATIACREVPLPFLWRPELPRIIALLFQPFIH